ncbi:MAG: DUF5777 family beta-barrel protein [Flavobacteriaceae bacterium]|nr:DUF5777 family beta-barrel protein [Flavobacteriaceae bacterium]
MKFIKILFLVFPILMYCQDDLLKEIDNDSLDPQYAEAAFKGLKIVNFESTKLAGKKELLFIVSHRFGSIEDGFDTFFGLDNAVTRLNFVFGISDAFNIGVSRSSYLKIYETSIKYRLFRQKENGFPFTIVGFNSLTINSALEKDNIPTLQFNDRLGYTLQLLISRKINTNFSVELAPTFFHDNYIELINQDKSQYALGFGGRYKLTKRWSINADYGWHLNRVSDSPFKNPLSIGFDLETGGHVFQLHFSNAQAMNTNGFLSQGSGDWSTGDIFFGFNLSRTF